MGAVARSRESRFSPAISRLFAACATSADELPDSETAILELLERHGASFTVDLARLSGLEPSRVRGALWPA